MSEWIRIDANKIEEIISTGDYKYLEEWLSNPQNKTWGLRMAFSEYKKHVIGENPHSPNVMQRILASKHPELIRFIINNQNFEDGYQCPLGIKEGSELICDLYNNCSNVQTENNNLKAYLSVLQTQIDFFQNTNFRLKCENGSLMEVNYKLKEDLQLQLHNKKEIENKNICVNKDLETQLLKHNEEITNLVEEYTQLKEENNLLQNENDRCKEENCMKGEDIKQLELKLLKCNEIVNDLMKEVKKYNKIVIKYKLRYLNGNN